MCQYAKAHCYILIFEYTNKFFYAHMSISQLLSLSKSIPVEQVCYNEQGLVPAIIQDYLDGTVLMMAWMNKESCLLYTSPSPRDFG